MNNMRKRIMSLALTGVLLMGSMPVQAWAEETQESVDPALTQQENDGGNEQQLANSGPVDLPIAVNGEQITSDKAADLLGDKKASFVADGNKLELSGADIGSLEFGTDLVICLKEGTVSKISDALRSMEDASAKWTNLKITGKGTLYVETIEITGNLEIVDAVVLVGTDREETENQDDQKTLIKVCNEIKVSGMAHLATATGHKALAITDSSQVDENQTNEPPKCNLTGDFYFRTDKEANFEKTSGTSVGPVNTVKYLEVISLGHLDTELASDENSHYKTCADEACVLGDTVAIDDEEHAEATKVESAEGGKHQKAYVCCGYVILTEDHRLTYTASEDGASILALCEPCGEVGSITLSVTNKDEDVQEENVKYTTNGVLEGEEAVLTYYAVDETVGEQQVAAPGEIGKYKVYMTYREITVSAEFEITKPSIDERATVTIAGEYEYDGTAKNPAPENISVKVGEKGLVINEDYTVSYGENINAGKGTVVITAVEGREYSGTKTQEFDIAPQEISKAGLQLEETELEYNGTKQVPALKESALKLGDDYTVTEPEQAIAVGQYKLSVEGKGNYKGSVELPYSIAKTEYYTDATKTAQISGLNVGDLEQPKFTGVKIGDSVETVAGTCKYTFIYKDSSTEAVWSAIQNRVNDEMKAGDKAVIQYTFTPAGDGNYTGTKSGEIEVTKVDLTFEFDDGTKATAMNVMKTGTITYGDTDAIKTAELTAKVNGVSGVKGKGFTVKYALDGATEKTDVPSVGSNQFWITYSGTIGGYSFTDVPVCEGWLSNVAPKTLAEGDLVPPRAVYISEKADGSPVELLTPAKKGYINDGKDGESLEYGLMTKDGWVDWSWKTKVPTATEEGCYDVYYRPSDNYTPRTEGYVRVLVVPYLTATYGDKFNEITLPAGFTFNKTEHPDLTKTVGDAGERNVYLDYTHPNDDPDVQNDYPTLTGYKVKMKVDPKEVTAIYSVLNAEVYDKNGDDWVAFASTTKDDLFIVKADGQKLVPGTDYTVEKTASADGLEVQHNFKCKDGGNYKFEPFSSERVCVYRAKHAKLESDNFPEEILKDSEYDTLDKAKKALKEEVKGEDTKCPDEYMKFFKIYLMKQSGARLADNQWVEHMEEGMFPPAGLTYEIPYADLDNATEKDAFRVAVLYLAGENEGKIIQLYKENGEFELTDTGLQINDLDREALVCVAREVDLTKEYTITKNYLYNGKTTTTSTGGTLTVKVDDKAVTKTTYGKTVVVTASAKSGYSVVGVAVTDASGNKVETKQSGSTYEFKMPASNVTVKLSLKKTTSSSKNPSSGDSSNIGLWIAVLAFSGISVLALLIVWLRKRKK